MKRNVVAVGNWFGSDATGRTKGGRVTMVIKASVTGLQEPQKLVPIRRESIKGKIEIADGLSKPAAIDSLEQGILMMTLLSQKLLTKED